MNQDKNILLSFVIIEYNSLEEILGFLTTIREKSFSLNYEIIVSSNSVYSPKKQQEVQREISGVKWVFNKKNGGFAYGMNRGMDVALGKYIIISNPDVKLLTPLDSMISYIEKHTNVGAIGPQILDKEGNIQDSFRKYITVLGFIFRHCERILRFQEKQFSSHENAMSVDWIIGAFILVRKEIFRQTNGLDEGYFLYCEDMDWCTRIRLSGYDVIYYPEMKIEYVGSRSARSSFRYAKIFFQSLFRYWSKFGFFRIKT